MYTVTKVMMRSYEGSGHARDRDWGNIHEARWKNIFQNELTNMAPGRDSVLFEWGAFPVGVVEALSDEDKKEILGACHLGWEKIADRVHWVRPWDWTDLKDAEISCEWALLLGGANLRMLQSHTHQGPLQRDGSGRLILSKEGQTQKFLDFTSSGWRQLLRMITDSVLPRIADAKMTLRSRMGEVDINAEFICAQCGGEFAGSKGYVVLDPERRPDGLMGLSRLRKGVLCLDCFGH